MAVDSLSTDFRPKVNVRVGTDTDYVDFDASLRETHTKDSEITDYPVESGAANEVYQLNGGEGPDWQRVCELVVLEA